MRNVLSFLGSVWLSLGLLLVSLGLVYLETPSASHFIIAGAFGFNLSVFITRITLVPVLYAQATMIRDLSKYINEKDL